MKLKNILNEMPLLIPSVKKDKSLLAQLTLEEQKKIFEHLIPMKGIWEQNIGKLTLKKVKNNYVLYDTLKILVYGLSFKSFNDGITVEWMENYSSMRGLTVQVFTTILKNDPDVTVIYSGAQHSPENKKMHQDLTKFKELNVDVWDDSKKEISFIDPYSGFSRGHKQFRFTLKK